MVDEPSPSPEATRAEVRAGIAAAAERDAAIGRLADAVRAASATVRSRRGEVEVTALASGAVDRVRIAEIALDLDPDALGRLVTSTIADAQRRAAEVALGDAEDALGVDSAVVADLRGQVRARWGAEGDGIEL